MICVWVCWLWWMVTIGERIHRLSPSNSNIEPDDIHCPIQIVFIFKINSLEIDILSMESRHGNGHSQFMLMPMKSKKTERQTNGKWKKWNDPFAHESLWIRLIAASSRILKLHIANVITVFAMLPNWWKFMTAFGLIKRLLTYHVYA